MPEGPKVTFNLGLQSEDEAADVGTPRFSAESETGGRFRESGSVRPVKQVVLPKAVLEKDSTRLNITYGPSSMPGPVPREIAFPYSLRRPLRQRRVRSDGGGGQQNFSHRLRILKIKR